MEHTQGLLAIDQYGNVTGDSERLFSLRVRGFTLSSSKAAEDNTRRIVACWNACAGIDTGALEQRHPESYINPRLAGVMLDSVKQQRDELLEALKGVIRVADRATVEFDAARAAIAKAEQ